MRIAAANRGLSDFLSLWAGTGIARSRSLPAADPVKQLLVDELHASTNDSS
jgi:hypothetical protein